MAFSTPSIPRLWLSSGLLVPLLLLTGAPATFAHGVKLEQRNSVEIEARYDNGQPMANAQVAVFPPDDPGVPLLTGTTDAQGQFRFVPDVERAGPWSVQVRQAGHGAIATVPVGPSEAATGAAPPSTGFTPLQTLALGAAVVWGCVGTALFFSRRSVAGTSSAATPLAPLTSDSHAHS